MLSRCVTRSRVPSRTLAAGVRVYKSPSSGANETQKKFMTPQEFIEKKRTDELENKQFEQALLNKPSSKKIQLVQENKLHQATQRPVPLNVELLHYKPLKVPQTHGHKVAELKFSGYEKNEVTRASEFAARAAYFLGIPCSDVIELKTEKRLYTVIRSPFAQAKSKENFFRTTYMQKLVAFDTNAEVLDLWLSYMNKHAIEKVDYSAHIHTRESLDFAKNLENLSAENMELPEAYAQGLDDPVGRKVQELLQSESFKQSMESK